jgi:hypothetical protein
VIPPLAEQLAIPPVGALVVNFAMGLRGCVLGIVCEPYRR